VVVRVRATIKTASENLAVFFMTPPCGLIELVKLESLGVKFRGSAIEIENGRKKTTGKRINFRGKVASRLIDDDLRWR
jgi:hypothetical protein